MGTNPRRQATAIVALLAVVAACSGGSDEPPTDADVDAAAQSVARAAQEEDARTALACDLDAVEESSWTTEETAVVTPTVAEAVDQVLQDQVWSSFGLPGGRRDALVDHAVEIERGTYVPVLVDRSLRVMLAIEARDAGFTSAGALRCR